jgi:hypothetical protein
MPVASLVDLQAIFVRDTGETMSRVMQQHRCNRREIERLAGMTQPDMLRNATGPEISLAELRRVYDAELSRPTESAIAGLLIGTLCDAPSRKLSAVRTFALSVALPRDELGEPLKRCRVTGARTLSGAIQRVLGDAAVFEILEEIRVNGPKGFAILQFKGGVDACFLVSQPAGPAFQPHHGISRVRSITPDKLRGLFDKLAGTGK